MRHAFWLLIAPLVLAGCQPESTQRERAEAACRARANQIDNRQNRADLARPDTSGTPFSAGGMPGIHTAPLVEQDVHDQNMQDCLDATGPLPDK